MSIHGILVVVGALMIIAEVILGAATGLDLALVGVALVVGGGVGAAVGSPAVGIAAAGVLALAYFIFGRARLRTRLSGRAIATNADALIGSRGVVLTPFDHAAAGQVKVNDEIWRARRSDGVVRPLPAGAAVSVVGIDGVTLLVRDAGEPGRNEGEVQ